MQERERSGTTGLGFRDGLTVGPTASFPQPPQPPMREHPQADRRREPAADGECLLQHRVLRVERRHEKDAEEHRDREIVPERRSQLHLLIVREIRHDNLRGSAQANHEMVGCGKRPTRVP